MVEPADAPQPLFGAWVWWQHGSERSVEYLTGYLVEKSLSVDNLFVFMLLLAAFAVPEVLKQRVLLYGIVGALVLRGVLIALDAVAISRFDFAFLVLGVILVLTAVKILEDAVTGHDHAVDAGGLRSVRFLRRFLPVAERYDGPRLLARAVDSVPAVYGITSDLYLVFVTNAFALLGLRALYFVLEGAMGRLVHLGYGLAAILAFIGAKLVLHWAHLRWESVPEVPTLASLGVILGILTVTVVTILVATGRAGSRDEREPELTR